MRKTRQQRNLTVLTIGYEGAGDNFIPTLCAHDIRRIVDVRHRPYSRNAHFSQATLRAWLADLRIRYVHIPELGIPASARQGDRDDVLERYHQRLLSDRSQDEPIERLADLMDGRTALLCREAAPYECHRSVLALALIDRFGGQALHLSTRSIRSEPAEQRLRLVR